MFRTTRWSLVTAAGGTGPTARAALHELCATYWRPLYAFLRRSGHDEHAALDATQAFVTTLLAAERLSSDAIHGRFRSYLLGALRHHLSNAARAQGAHKRGGLHTTVSLDDAEGRYAAEPHHDATPQAAFERSWALALLERATARLRDEYAARDRSVQWQVLSPYLQAADGNPDYAQAAADLASTAGAIKVAVHRMRRRLGELVREEIAQTVADPADVDGELRILQQALADSM